MNVLALVVVALVQLVSLDLPQLRETIEAITTALSISTSSRSRAPCAGNERVPAPARLDLSAIESAGRRCFAVQRKGPAM